MPEPLKNLYNDHFLGNLSQILEEVLPAFEQTVFLESIYSQEWEKLELKGRMRHISGVLHQFLPKDFAKALPYIVAVKDKAVQAKLSPLACLFLPDYVEQYGLFYPTLSMQALEQITSFISAEFAVRPFLIRYPELMLTQMLQWSTHSSEHIRRLASEGIRPRLPWAMAVPLLKKEPALILPVLENLKADPSEYVRRSVANNLNDISKDHPQLVTDLARKWKGTNPLTDKLLKHGCRTLLKKGNDEVLNLFGFNFKNTVKFIQPLVLTKDVLEKGDILEFSCSCTCGQLCTVRLQYLISFPGKSGKIGTKTFYLCEKKIDAGQEYRIQKKIKLQDYSTRKLYAGKHRIAIMLNGEIKTDAFFYLNVF